MIDVGSCWFSGTLLIDELGQPVFLRNNLLITSDSFWQRTKREILPRHNSINT